MEVDVIDLLPGNHLSGLGRPAVRRNLRLSDPMVPVYRIFKPHLRRRFGL